MGKSGKYGILNARYEKYFKKDRGSTVRICYCKVYEDCELTTGPKNITAHCITEEDINAEERR